VDVEAKTKAQLIEEAARNGAHVTSHMTKAEIADTIEKAIHANDRKRRERE
jgi:hypothetical protein